MKCFAPGLLADLLASSLEFSSPPRTGTFSLPHCQLNSLALKQCCVSHYFVLYKIYKQVRQRAVFWGLRALQVLHISTHGRQVFLHS